MPARTYAASGLSHPGALPRLIITCFIVAVISGLVEGVISRWISLLLLFPAILGAVVGATALRVVDKAHIRAPLFAALVAGLAGLLSEGTLHGVQYYEFRSNMRGEMELSADNSGLADRLIDTTLEAQTGKKGFVGYLMLRARVGTEIKKAGQSSGLKMQGTAFWVLLVINFLIAGGIAAGMAWERARAPYCEACQRWYDRTEDVANGSADKSAVDATMKAIDRGAYLEVPGVLGAATNDSVSLLQMLRCGSCTGHEPQLSYTVVTGIGKKQKTKKALITLLRPEDAKSLVGAFEKKS